MTIRTPSRGPSAPRTSRAARAAPARRRRWLLAEALEPRTHLDASYLAGNAAELIAAMTAANTDGTFSTVTLAPGGTFAFTARNNSTIGQSREFGANALPIVQADLAIVGNGNTLERAAGSLGFRFFQVDNASLSLANLTLTGGLAQGRGQVAQGGAVAFFSGGTLSLRGVTISGNRAAGFSGDRFNGESGRGGGVYVSGGTVAVRNSVFTDNDAEGHSGGDRTAAVAGGGGGGFGGGLFVAGGTVALVDNTFSYNLARGGDGGNGTAGSTAGGVGGVGAGGGLFAGGGAVTLAGNTFNGNEAEGGKGGGTATVTGAGSRGGGGGVGSGGGIQVGGGAVALRNVTLSSNGARGGAAGAGGSSTGGNFGGDGGTGGYGTGGGLAVSGGTATVVNATIAGNAATGGTGGEGGDGIGDRGGANGNGSGGGGGDGIGGGLYLAGGTTALANTLIALNAVSGGTGGAAGSGSFPGPVNGPGGAAASRDASGAAASSFHNLIGSSSGFSSAAAAGEILDRSPVSVGLAALANNGGPTQTMALLGSSPAVNAGDPKLAAAATDQRGYARVVGTAVDIGAYEFGAEPAVSDLSVTGSAPATVTAGGQITYALAVANNGPNAQSNVTLADVLPAGTTLVSWAGPAGWSVVAPAAGSAGGTVSVSIPLLPAGASTVFTLVVQVNAAVGEVIRNTATVGPVTGDPIADNNSVRFETTVESATIATTTAVTTSAATSTYGGSLTFTATVDGTATPTGSVNFVIDGGSPIAGVAGATAGTTATWTLTTSALSAGNHTVQAFYVGAGTFGDSDGSLAGGQVVNKADATVVVTPYSVTYDGLAKAATVTSITGVNGETGAAVGTVVLDTTHTNAGTYEDAWSFVGGANYNDIASTAITNTIGKAESTVQVSVAGGPFTYTGVAQTPATVLVSGAGGLVLTPAAAYADNVNAGTATAGYTFAGDANHTGSADSETFAIGKADAAVVVTPYSVTYDGAPHAAAYTVDGVNGETGAAVGAVTLSPAHTDAGTYADAWSFAGGANYNSIAATPMTNVIGKAGSTVTVTINGGPFTYTGLAQTPATVSVTGAGGLSLTPDAAYAGNVNAGTATASYEYAGDANHEPAAGAADFAIGKADATFTVTPYAVTYDRTPHAATVSAVTGVNGESGAAVGAVTLDTTHTDAGVYDNDSWSFAGGANYNDVAATPITNTIDRAELTITADDDVKVFGTVKTFATTAFAQTGLIAGDAITGVTLTSAGAPAVAGVGAYAIEPSAAAGSGLANYDIDYVDGTLTVFPPVTVPAGVQQAFEDVDKSIAGISIAPGLSGNLTLTLAVGQGTLKLAKTTGLTVAGNNTGTVSLTGTTANLNAALAGLVYRGRLNYSGADTLSLTLGDGNFSWTADVAINVASAAQQAGDLRAQVNALRNAGVLSVKHANVLLANLSLVGNNGDVGKVASFLNNVAGYQKSKVLTPAQASALLTGGNVLLLSVTRR